MFCVLYSKDFIEQRICVKCPFESKIKYFVNVTKFLYDLSLL